MFYRSNSEFGMASHRISAIGDEHNTHYSNRAQRGGIQVPDIPVGVSRASPCSHAYESPSGVKWINMKVNTLKWYYVLDVSTFFYHVDRENM